LRSSTLEPLSTSKTFALRLFRGRIGFPELLIFVTFPS
jgi:hypothetical protein